MFQLSILHERHNFKWRWMNAGENVLAETTVPFEFEFTFFCFAYDEIYVNTHAIAIAQKSIGAMLRLEARFSCTFVFGGILLLVSSFRCLSLIHLLFGLAHARVLLLLLVYLILLCRHQANVKIPEWQCVQFAINEMTHRVNVTLSFRSNWETFPTHRYMLRAANAARTHTHEPILTYGRTSFNKQQQQQQLTTRHSYRMHKIEVPTHTHTYASPLWMWVVARNKHIAHNVLVSSYK